MGVRDLMRWVKTKYPNVITNYPRRFADPYIRDLTIGTDSDGTLLTNRFHFAVFDQPLEDKSAMIGWYYLINDMRKNGVQPIAIWDEPGVRPWKALEARRRMATRALQLARKRHEQRRQVRLLKLKDLARDLSQTSTTNQLAISRHWEFTKHEIKESPESSGYLIARLGNLQKQLTRQILKGSKSAHTNLAFSSNNGSPTSPAFTNLVTRLVQIISDFRFNFRPSQRINDQTLDDIARSLKEEEEELASIIGTDEDGIDPHSPTDITSMPRDALSALDSRLADVIPDESYIEAPSQHRLTIEEGVVIDLALSLRDGSLFKAIEGNVKNGTPVELLDHLIAQTPAIERIYSSALNVPTKQDHLNCRELLVKMGVPVLEATIPYEAEGLASALAKAGLVDFVGTEDSDVIAYEAPLLRNVTSSKNPLTLIDSSRLRELSHLTASAFHDFCILLGTDASPRIRRIGLARAGNLIQKHGSIEALLASEPLIKERIENEEEYMDMVHSARRLFGELPPIPEGLSLEQGVWKERDVEKWLEEVHGIQLVALPDELEEAMRWPEDVSGLQGREPEAWDESLDPKSK